MITDTAVFLKFDTLHLLENYLKSVYYNTYPLTLYFQVQFIKAHCSLNANNAFTCALEKEQFSTRQERVLDVKNGKYHKNPE